ncbi:MAG: hypothetical protein HY687_05945 [Chloroflexi bacterium]|nr:hypothetical protein [Chloroflexota bacterium]
MKRLLAWLLVGALLALPALAPGRDRPQEPPWEAATRPYGFPLVSWELEHLPQKWLFALGQALGGESKTTAEKRERVRAYFQLVSELSHLSEGEGARRAILEAQKAAWKGEVEATLEEEVAAVLEEEGLASPLGFLFPPVDFTFSDLPRVLIISPRERIEVMDRGLLRPVSAAEMEAIEAAAEAGGPEVQHPHGVSALVTPIGGIATYPAMVLPSATLEGATETIAHEWLHAYFFFQPLGRGYFGDYQVATINETAASMAGREMGERALTRLGVVREQGPETEPARPREPSELELALRETRLEVDALLAEGKIGEAEALMEARQRALVGKGYQIRKLNQAYFAFYGSYADAPGAVSPVGEQLRELRRRSPTLGAFVRAAAGIGSAGELEALLGK